MPDERSLRDRRTSDRRVKASEALDVSRAEHENLATQVAKNTQVLRRLEVQLAGMRDELHALRTVLIGRSRSNEMV